MSGERECVSEMKVSDRSMRSISDWTFWLTLLSWRGSPPLHLSELVLLKLAWPHESRAFNLINPHYPNFNYNSR